MKIMFASLGAYGPASRRAWWGFPRRTRLPWRALSLARCVQRRSAARETCGCSGTVRAASGRWPAGGGADQSGAADFAAN